MHPFSNDASTKLEITSYSIGLVAKQKIFENCLRLSGIV